MSQRPFKGPRIAGGANARCESLPTRVVSYQDCSMSLERPSKFHSSLSRPGKRNNCRKKRRSLSYPGSEYLNQAIRIGRVAVLATMVNLPHTAQCIFPPQLRRGVHSLGSISLTGLGRHPLIKASTHTISTSGQPQVDIGEVQHNLASDPRDHLSLGSALTIRGTRKQQSFISKSASGESKISQFKETILRLDFSGLILNGEFSDHRGTSGFHHEKITSQPGAGSDKDVAPGKPNRCPRPSWRRGLPSRTRRMMHAGRFLRSTSRHGEKSSSIAARPPPAGMASQTDTMSGKPDQGRTKQPQFSFILSTRTHKSQEEEDRQGFFRD
ncbi:hypothetical protein BGZ60DRAFT_436468 [Tricladium varicosporioides]|nr:hypothetical protein BGZ60DRAFT_436468 [Hymenoscyphus varicosporioides]